MKIMERPYKYKDLKGKTVKLYSGRIGKVVGIKTFPGNEIVLLLEGDSEPMSDAGIGYVREIVDNSKNQ